MKKFLIISAYIILILIGILYGAFLIAPHFICLDKFKPEIQKLVLENSKLKLDYSNLKLYTTPLLSVGAIIDNLTVKLPDNTNVVEIPKIKAGIALPSLLTLTVKTANCYIENPKINLEIENGKQYKLVKVIEDLINENNAKPKEESLNQELPIDLDKITIKVPFVKILNYQAKVIDLNSGHNLTLSGEDLILGYNSKKNTAKLKTFATLFSDDNTNITADIDVVSSIPKFEKTTNDVDPEEKIEIPFINLIDIYQKYDLKADIVSKLHFFNSEKRGYVARGFLNIDNLKLKLSNIQLPESYLHSTFHGKTIEYDSNLYATKEEKLSLDGVLKYGKNPSILANIKTEKIQFENLLSLFEGLLNSLNIKNDIPSIKTTGYLVADASIKTDFKKLKSEGSILVKDGSFINYKTGIGIKNIIANLIFENDALKIKDTSAIINNSKLTVEGKIDNNSNTDIKLDVNNLSIPALYNAFAPKELKREFLINSSLLTAHIDIEGKLDSLNAKLKTTLNNFSLSDIKRTMFLSNSKADIDFHANANEIKGSIDDSGFLFNMPKNKTTLKVDNVKINISNDKISLLPFDLLFNNISKINVKGDITNYLKEPDINFFVSGNILTSSIKQSLGKDISYYLDSKGSIASKVTISGNAKKQDIVAQIYSDSNNYITPVNIKQISGSPVIAQADIKINGNKIKIKNSGLYKKAQNGFSDNLEDNLAGSSQIAELAASLDNNHINLFRLNVPEELTGSISVFKKSSFKTKGKITLNGYLDDLNYGGNFKIWNLTIPEIKTTAKSIDLDLSGQNVNLDAKEINLNGSKVDTSLKTSLNFSNVFKVNDLNIDSNSINVDKLMEVVDGLFKYMPPTAPSKASTKTAKAPDIPLLANGKFNIKEIKTGNIYINNAKGDIDIKNNNLHINKLTCKAFNGDVSGNITVNLISQLISAKLSGKNVNADKLLVDTANMKNTITGSTSFKTDVSLKGTTYLEQVKSLKGVVNFHIKDGVYGPFAKLENFFLAENIRNNPIFSNTIGVILSPLTTINCSKFENLEGKLIFKDGIAYLDSIGSQGELLSLLIKGNMNLVTNEIESSVKARLASAISDLLGPLAVANPVNLVKKTPGLNVATAKLFKVFTSVVTESEYKEIPEFSSKHSDANATKFQIVLKGDTTKPLKLVKSFKWMALQEDMDKAEAFATEYVKEQEDIAKQALINKLQTDYEKDNKLRVGVEKVLQMDTTAPAVKKVLVEEVIKNAQTKKTGSSTNAENLEKAKEELKQQIQDAANKKAQEKLNAWQEKIKAEKEAKAKAEAEAKAKQEAEAKAKQEAEAKAKQEAEAKAKQEAEAANKAQVSNSTETPAN